MGVHKQIRSISVKLAARMFRLVLDRGNADRHLIANVVVVVDAVAAVVDGVVVDAVDGGRSRGSLRSRWPPWPWRKQWTRRQTWYSGGNPDRRHHRLLLVVAGVADVAVEGAVAADVVGRPPALGIRCAVPRSASIADPAAGAGHCYCRCCCSEYC